jgi:hypothetical protein
MPKPDVPRSVADVVDRAAAETTEEYAQLLPPNRRPEAWKRSVQEYMRMTFQRVAQRHGLPSDAIRAVKRERLWWRYLTENEGKVDSPKIRALEALWIAHGRNLEAYGDEIARTAVADLAKITRPGPGAPRKHSRATIERVRDLQAQGLGLAEIARSVGIPSAATVQAILRQHLHIGATNRRPNRSDDPGTPPIERPGRRRPRLRGSR